MPVSDLLYDFVGSDQTVPNVFLEANLASNGLKLATYSNWVVLNTKLSSVNLPPLHLMVTVSEQTGTNFFYEENKT